MGKTVYLQEGQLRKMFRYMEENPIDRDRYEMINEAYSRVNNIDEIVDGIYEFLIEKGPGLLRYNKEKIKLTTKYGVDYWIYKFKGRIGELNNEFFNGLEIWGDLYYCGNEDKYYRYLKSTPGTNNFVLRRNGYFDTRTGGGMALFTPIYFYKNQIYVDKNLLKHEITHYYQILLNPAHEDDEKFKNYAKTYKNNEKLSQITTNELVKDATDIMYFFMPTEIAANTARLDGELRDLGINRKNYSTIFQETPLYEDYSYAIRFYNNLKNASDEEWDFLRKELQKAKVFHEETRLNRTTDTLFFKKLFLQYIDKQIIYFNKRVQKAKDSAVGAYQGKREDETYTTKNQRLSGQRINRV
jgi:hypothetical protein